MQLRFNSISDTETLLKNGKTRYTSNVSVMNEQRYPTSIRYSSSAHGRADDAFSNVRYEGLSVFDGMHESSSPLSGREMHDHETSARMALLLKNGRDNAVHQNTSDRVVGIYIGGGV